MWSNPLSSTRMREIYLDMASMVRISASEGFSWEEMANEHCDRSLSGETKNFADRIRGDADTKRSKTKRSLGLGS